MKTDDEGEVELEKEFHPLPFSALSLQLVKAKLQIGKVAKIRPV
jgi:hypothetical protein